VSANTEPQPNNPPTVRQPKPPPPPIWWETDPSSRGDELSSLANAALDVIPKVIHGENPD
jgi:hypothetical protein